MFSKHLSTLPSVFPLLAALLTFSHAEDSWADEDFPSLTYENFPRLLVPDTLEKDTLAFDLFRDIVAAEKGNVIFSPASLESVLQRLKGISAGRTRATLEALPHGKSGVASRMTPQSAGGLFVAADMETKPGMEGNVQRVDFSHPEVAAQTVNEWCRKHTGGLITSFATPADMEAGTRLMALNAVYLQEAWVRPFRGRRTCTDFHTSDGGTVTVQMMYAKDDFPYAKGEDWKAVALFYHSQGRKGEPGCFIAILPKGDAREFAATLTAEKFNEIRRGLLESQRKVNEYRPMTEVYCPVMTAAPTTLSLRDILSKHGLEELFVPGKADFSVLCDEPTALRDVRQQCYIRVDEKGTSAAVATGACNWLCADEEQPVIRLDRPFIWVIGDLRTGAAPLFIGLCESPEPQGGQAYNVQPFEESPECGWTIPGTLHGWNLQRVLVGSNRFPLNELHAVQGDRRVKLYESPRPVRVCRTLGDFWICQDCGCAHGPKTVFVVRVDSGSGQPTVVFRSQDKDSPDAEVDEFKNATLKDGALLLEWERTPVFNADDTPPQTLQHRISGK